MMRCLIVVEQPDSGVSAAAYSHALQHRQEGDQVVVLLLG